MAIKSKAAVLHKSGLPRPYVKSQPILIEEVEIDEPEFGEVLVKVFAAGLCHSDLSVVNGNRPKEMPILIGHEGAGIIEKIGEGVDGFEVGDHVVFVFIAACGSCIKCKEGKPSLCTPGMLTSSAGTLLSGKKKIKLKNKYINHHVGVSCFSEYTVVSSKSLVKVNKDIPLDEAALMGCAVITGAGAVFNTAKIRVGSTNAIFGLGGTGLAALMGARAAGASKVIGVDLLDSKLNLAKDLGADLVLKVGDDTIEKIKKFTEEGVDYAFECVGSERSLEMAYKCLKRGGEVISSGLSNPKNNFVINHVDLVVGEKIIKGSYLGSCIPSRDIPAYIDLYKTGRLPINNLMSDKISLEQINEGFDKLADGDVVRQIIIF